jgi:hypothetical protein
MNYVVYMTDKMLYCFSQKKMHLHKMEIHLHNIKNMKIQVEIAFEHLHFPAEVLQLIVVYLRPYFAERLKAVMEHLSLFDAPELAIELLAESESCIGQKCVRTMCYGCCSEKYESQYESQC